MKSSTLRRSNLSKEKMEVLAALSNYRQELKDNETPEVYVREDKENELDVLWQSFKSNQKFEKSPGIYLTTGFIGGAVTVLLISLIIGLFSNSPKTPSDESLVSTEDVSVSVDNNKQKKSHWFSFSSSKSDRDESTIVEEAEQIVAPVENKLYEVKNGDTMGKILIQFYGNASKENEEKVLKANGMTNPNKLTAGDKIKIPVDINE